MWDSRIILDAISNNDVNGALEHLLQCVKHRSRKWDANENWERVVLRVMKALLNDGRVEDVLHLARAVLFKDCKYMKLCPSHLQLLIENARESYYREGHVDPALQQFFADHRIQQYDDLINAFYSRLTQLQQLRSYREMEQELEFVDMIFGIESAPPSLEEFDPDSFARYFDCKMWLLLQRCDEMDAAERVLQEARMRGVRLARKHYVKLMEQFAKAERYDKANEIVELMKQHGHRLKADVWIVILPNDIGNMSAADALAYIDSRDIPLPIPIAVLDALLIRFMKQKNHEALDVVLSSMERTGICGKESTNHIVRKAKQCIQKLNQVDQGDLK